MLERFDQLLGKRSGVLRPFRQELALVDSFNADAAANQAEHRENPQRPGHHRRRFVRMFSVLGFGGTVKHHKNQAEHVKCRQHRHQQTNRKEQVIALVGGLRDDAVLAEESAERPQRGQRQRAEQEGPEGHRHFLSQPAHLPDVLLVVKPDDDRTRTHEQQRLEERVCGQMKHRRRRPMQTHRHHHVAKL